MTITDISTRGRKTTPIAAPISPDLYDEDIERAVLACLVNRPKLIRQAVHQISADEFFFVKHREIFLSILTIYHQMDLKDMSGAPITRIDIPLLSKVTEQRGKLGPAEGQVSRIEIARIVEQTNVLPQNLKGYLELLVEISGNRRVATVASEIKVAAEDRHTRLFEKLPSFLKRLSSIMSWQAGGKQIRGFRSKQESVDTFLDRLYAKENEEKAAEQGDSVTRKKVARRMPLFGITALDGKVEGKTQILPMAMLEDSSLISILADTGSGKTTFSLFLEWFNIAERGLKVLHFTAETPIDTLEKRIVSALSGVDYKLLYLQEKRGNVLNDKQKKAVADAVKRWKEVPGKVDFRNVSGWTGERLKAEAILLDELEQATSEDGRGYDFMVIDYLQALACDKSKDSKDNRDDIQVGNNVKAIREIAMELGIAAVMFSQVTGGREGGNRHVRVKPGIHSGARTSEIENDSQLVMCLYWDKTQKDANGNPVPPVIYVAKENNGKESTQEVPLIIEAGKFRYQDISEPSKVSNANFNDREMDVLSDDEPERGGRLNSFEPFGEGEEDEVDDTGLVA